jgi:LPXTG-site transpeptidase (sortase) family protein
MTTTPGRVGRRAAYGLAAIIAAVYAVVASEPSALAAINMHSPHFPQPTAKRNIWHERLLRNAGETPDARPPAPDRTAGRAPKAARPWTIAVPSIGLAAGVMTLGGPDGTAGPEDLSLPVPPLAKAATDAGWYEFTAVPGAAGNAVIVGHVDTYTGPAVFYDLYQLRPGDRIYVSTGGGRQRFDVTSVRELPKPRFPVNQVFGATERHMLWLITCGGAFDYDTGHYLDNIIVSANWVPESERNRDEKTDAKRSEKSSGKGAPATIIGKHRVRRLSPTRLALPARSE